jgi:hypothetical protein
MSEWRILDEPALDRIGISNSDIGCDVYLPHWSSARIETAHSPPESGIRAELLRCHTTDTWNYSLSHIEVKGPGGDPTPAYLLEVWIEYCLVTKVQLPCAFGEKLRHKWLERS